MKNCIFCQIVQKTLPAHIIFENDHIMAFLDIAPINIGHTLVIPKKHYESPSPASDAELLHVMKVASHIGLALVRTGDYDGYNLHLANGGCAGQTVPHFHLHVVPRIGTDGFHWNWRSQKYLAGQEAAIVASIKHKLKIDEL